MNVIKSKAEIELIFNSGTWARHALLRILVKEHSPQRDQTSGRVAFIAGKKIGTAPQRSRSKRLLREAARIAKLPIDGYDIILIATVKTRSCNPQKLSEVISRLLQKEGV